MNRFRSDRLCTTILVGTSAALFAPAIQGQSAAVAVGYQAPSGCPSESEFLSEVRQRNPRVIAATPLESLLLRVAISEGASPRFSGRLERTTSTGSAGVREIDGDDCREVASALALITAMTADLLAMSQVSSAVADKVPPDVGPPELGTSRATVRPDSPRATQRAPTPAPESNGVSPLRWKSGASGLLVQGVTPALLLGATLFAETSGRGLGTWVPRVRLSGSLAQSSWTSSRPDSSATANFLWAVASLDGCPLQLGAPLELSVHPCVRVTAGVLNAAGGGRPSPQNENRFWADLGVVLGARWQLTRVLFAEGEAELFVPRVLYSFQFENPADTAYIVHQVGSRFGAGLGITFR
jgi:hypothetical protein